MITRSYSPPFQIPAPQPGAETIGSKVKGLVAVEVARTNEVSFAVESFGCDGKPVLSLLRGLSCETSGTPVIAGTKNGMPFRLNGDLPRGIGSAIRGSGGGLRTVTGGAALRSDEWVLYDNFGNHWSLDTLTDGDPTYLGETPVEAGESTVALCTQDPRIRPYEKRWEFIQAGGDGGHDESRYYWGGAGWIEDDVPGAVLASPVTFPYALPAEYWRVEQYMPDETTYPTGASHSPHWPSSVRHVEVEWYPARTDTPLTWAAVADNSLDVLMAQYGTTPPWSYYANRWTRPLLEHISIGGVTGEASYLVCVEKDNRNAPFVSRVALRVRGSGVLLSSLSYTPRSDARHMITPDKSEGWILQTGAVSFGTATLTRYRSRASSVDAFGSALTANGTYAVTLPSEYAHEWTAEPVWFRVGKVTRILGGSPRLVPRLPLWR